MILGGDYFVQHNKQFKGALSAKYIQLIAQRRTGESEIGIDR